MLRSTAVAGRSLLHHSRTFYSTQPYLGSDEVVMDSALQAFSLPSPIVLTNAPTRKHIPLSKIEILPAKDPLLELFASRLMWCGKRARAEKCTSEILLQINALTKAPALPILRQAVELAAPAVRMITHKHGGKAIEKPVALNERQRTRRAVDWVLEESNSRPGYTRGERIARECIRIVQGSSNVLEKKAKEHKRAMVNRGNLPRIRR